jgi:hypothetical protein
VVVPDQGSNPGIAPKKTLRCARWLVAVVRCWRRLRATGFRIFVECLGTLGKDTKTLGKSFAETLSKGHSVANIPVKTCRVSWKALGKEK